MELDIELWLGLQKLESLGGKIEGKITAVTKETSTLQERAGKEDLVLHIDSGNMKYRLRLNMTSTIALVNAYGRETNNWIGKTILVQKGKVRNRDAVLVSTK